LTKEHHQSAKSYLTKNRVLGVSLNRWLGAAPLKSEVVLHRHPHLKTFCLFTLKTSVEVASFTKFGPVQTGFICFIITDFPAGVNSFFLGGVATLERGDLALAFSLFLLTLTEPLQQQTDPAQPRHGAAVAGADSFT